MDTTNLPPMTDQAVPVQPTGQPVVTPVSIGNKEAAPAALRTEYVTPSPAETVPRIPKELAALGIEVSPDTDRPDVPPDARQAGVQTVKTAAPVTTTPQGVVMVPAPQTPTPVTYQQAVTNLKSHKADESISWLSMLSKYVLEKFGIQKVG